MSSGLTKSRPHSQTARMSAIKLADTKYTSHYKLLYPSMYVQECTMEQESIQGDGCSF